VLIAVAALVHAAARSKKVQVSWIWWRFGTEASPETSMTISEPEETNLRWTTVACASQTLITFKAFVFFFGAAAKTFYDAMGRAFVVVHWDWDRCCVQARNRSSLETLQQDGQWAVSLEIANKSKWNIIISLLRLTTLLNMYPENLEASLGRLGWPWQSLTWVWDDWQPVPVDGCWKMLKDGRC